WDALVDNAGALNVKELLSTLDSLDGGFASGEMTVDDYLDRVKAFVQRDDTLPAYEVARAPMSRLAWIKTVLVPTWGRDGAKKYIADLYQPIYAKLGLDANTPYDESDPAQAALMRTPVVTAIAIDGEMPDVRAELAGRGA